jgi:hypothetical protein
MVLHCDCTTGINKAFNQYIPLKLQDSCYDLLKAIRHETSMTRIAWSGSHIKALDRIESKARNRSNAARENQGIDPGEVLAEIP